MNYITAYYLKGRGRELFLEEYCALGSKVVIGGLFEGNPTKTESPESTVANLETWSHHFPWCKLAKTPSKGIRRIEAELSESKITEDAILFAGIEEEIFLQNTSHSNYRAYAISGFFGAGHARKITGDFRGKAESGAGILLASADFMEGVEERQIGQALRFEGEPEEKQALRHLKELAGGRDGAAILIIFR